MGSNLKKAAIAAIREWCTANGYPAKEIKDIRHVHPRALVIGHAAPRCIIVSRPWQDSEPQCKEFDKANPLDIIRTFDHRLDSGMWCATAYVVNELGGETVAVIIEE